MSDDSSQLITLFHNSGAVGLILYMVVVLVAALIFIGFFFLVQRLCAKWESIRRPEQAAATNPQRRSFHFPQQSPTHHGLDPSVLKSLPVVAFSTKEEFKEVLECSVCLSEIETGEKARLLPKCYHGFHLDCIDMWFQSHSTCPVCRNPVSTQLRKPGITPFWENSNQASDLEAGLVLEEEEEDGHDRNFNELPSSSSSSAPLSSTGNPGEPVG